MKFSPILFAALCFLLTTLGCDRDSFVQHQPTSTQGNQASQPVKEQTPTAENQTKGFASQQCKKIYDIKGVDLCLEWKSIPDDVQEMHQEFPVELKLHNLGRTAATAATVNIWTQNMELHSMNSEIPCEHTASGISCHLQNIQPDGVVELPILCKAMAAGGLVITAHVSSGKDENTVNDEAKPIPKIMIRTSVNSESDYTSKFLAARDACVKLHGNDKAALRQCMIEAKDQGKM